MPKVLDRIVWANRAEPDADQTAPRGASSLFVI